MLPDIAKCPLGRKKKSLQLRTTGLYPWFSTLLHVEITWGALKTIEDATFKNSDQIGRKWRLGTRISLKLTGDSIVQPSLWPISNPIVTIDLQKEDKEVSKKVTPHILKGSPQSKDFDYINN